MGKKKIGEFSNKPTPASSDLFLIQDASTGIYYNVTKSQLVAIFSIVYTNGSYLSLTGNSFNVDFSTFSTTQITEGTNLYFTNARALAAAPAETAASIGAIVNAATSATPNDTDLVMSVESSVAKKSTWTQIKAFLKTYFDAVYQTKYTDVSDNQIITGTSITLPNTPIFIYGVFMNGQRLTITTDYTISGVTITLVNAASSDLFTTVYKY